MCINKLVKGSRQQKNLFDEIYCFSFEPRLTVAVTSPPPKRVLNIFGISCCFSVTWNRRRRRRRCRRRRRRCRRRRRR